MRLCADAPPYFKPVIDGSIIEIQNNTGVSWGHGPLGNCDQYYPSRAVSDGSFLYPEAQIKGGVENDFLL
jgi:hypothetical protein